MEDNLVPEEEEDEQNESELVVLDPTHVRQTHNFIINLYCPVFISLFVASYGACASCTKCSATATK